MLLRPIARPLLASWFVVGGLDGLRRPNWHVAVMRDALAGYEARARRLSADRGKPWPVSEVTDTQLTAVVRAHGVASLVAAGMFATGRAPRLSAAALAALAVPVVVVNAPIARTRGTDAPAREPHERELRRRQFWSGLTALGGALLAAADYEGRPGVRWRIGEARVRRSAVRDAVREVSAQAAAQAAAQPSA